MTDITVTELAGMTDPVVVDVRESYEFEAGHAAGALLIPLGELGRRLVEVPRGAPVYVICAAGGRSLQGAALLERHGIEAVNVTGGMNAWQQAGLTAVQGEVRE